MFNLIDIINTCAVSVGVSLYLSTENPIFVTVGLVVAVVGILILLLLLVVYAVQKGRKIAIGV